MNHLSPNPRSELQWHHGSLQWEPQVPRANPHYTPWLVSRSPAQKAASGTSPAAAAGDPEQRRARGAAQLLPQTCSDTGKEQQ